VIYRIEGWELSLTSEEYDEKVASGDVARDLRAASDLESLALRIYAFGMSRSEESPNFAPSDERNTYYTSFRLVLGDSTSRQRKPPRKYTPCAKI